MNMRSLVLAVTLATALPTLAGCSALRSALGSKGDASKSSATSSAGSDPAAAEAKQAEALRKAAEASRKALSDGLGTPGPIDAGLWGDFNEAVAAFAAYRPDAPQAFKDAAFSAYVRDARLSETPEESLAALFVGSSLLAKQTVTGVKGKLAFKVPADTCFVVLGNPHPGTNKTRIKQVVWNKDFLAVHTFKGNTYEPFEGACASRAVSMEYAVESDGAGSKKAADWYVLAWPRAEFPVEIASLVGVTLQHRCSAQWVYNAFTDGVPGMLVWQSGRPGLRVWDRDICCGLWLPSKPLKSWTAEVTAAWSPSPAIEWGSFDEPCDEFGRTPDPAVAKAQACHEGLDKKHRAKVKAAEEKRRWAKVDLERAKPAQWGSKRRAYEAADKAYWRLANAEISERRSKCGPLEAAYKKAMEDMLPRLGDWFLAGPQGGPGIDVPAYRQRNSAALAP